MVLDAATLRTLRIFEQAPEDQLEGLAAAFEEVTLPAGEVIARAGDFGYRFFGILEGVAGVTRDKQHVAVLQTGDSFGELALVGDERRTATVVATSDMRVASLMAWEFREIEERYPEIWAQITTMVEERWP